MTEAKAAATVAEQVIANAEPGKEAQVEGKTAIPGEGVKDSGPDSFADEDAALQALIAEQARLEAEAAGQVDGKPKEGGTAGTTGEVKEGDAAAAVAKAKADADALAAAAANATNPQTQAFIALRKKVSDLTGALLIKEGENRALKAMVDPAKAGEADTGEPAPAEQTIDEALDEIYAERKRLGKLVDQGTMSMEQREEELEVLAKRERALTLAEAAAMAEAAANANAKPPTDLALDEWTNNTLIPSYPVLAKLTKAQLDPIAKHATSELEFEGVPITSDSSSETKRFREKIAELAERKHDPAAYAARKAKTAAAPASGQPAASNVSALPTAAQREAKLALAAGMPPEIGKTGAGAPAGELTEEQIAAAMSGSEDARIAFIESHPALIQKVMGPGFRFRR